MFGFRNIFRSLSLHRLAPSLIRWFLWGYFLFFFAFLYIGTISRTFHGSISSWYPVSIGWSYFHTISLFFIFLNIVTTVLGFVHQFSKIFLCGPFSLRNRPSISNWKQVHPKKKLKSTFFLKNVSSLRSTWVNLRDADGRALFHFPFLIILFFHYTFLFLFFFWVGYFFYWNVCVFSWVCWPSARAANDDDDDGHVSRRDAPSGATGAASLRKTRFLFFVFNWNQKKNASETRRREPNPKWVSARYLTGFFRVKK